MFVDRRVPWVPEVIFRNFLLAKVPWKIPGIPVSRQAGSLPLAHSTQVVLCVLCSHTAGLAEGFLTIQPHLLFAAGYRFLPRKWCVSKVSPGKVSQVGKVSYLAACWSGPSCWHQSVPGFCHLPLSLSPLRFGARSTFERRFE